MREFDSDFNSVPLPEQQKQTKIHTIDLRIDFPPLLSCEGEISVCCKSLLRNTHIDHKFGWGDNERLECVVRNTPVLQCDCGSLMQAEVALLIQERANAIANYFEFQTQEDFDKVVRLLPPIDIMKVYAFAKAIRNEPYFISDGTFSPVVPFL